MADPPPAESSAAAPAGVDASRPDVSPAGASPVGASRSDASPVDAFPVDAFPVDAFRDEVRGWLEANLTGEFAAARGLGGPGREDEGFEVRRAWERRLGAAGWTCLGWPAAYGGRDASL